MRGQDGPADEFFFRERLQQLNANTPPGAGFGEQDIAAGRALGQAQISLAGIEPIERLGDLFAGDIGLLRGKTRYGAVRLVDPVAAEQEDLARLPMVFEPG
ncbi:MAG: hypothetical protein PHE55_04335 [Methylococcaceae bacterium]|nr:hypothetical protein [Methylococcaceae bacterium]